MTKKSLDPMVFNEIENDLNDYYTIHIEPVTRYNKQYLCITNGLMNDLYKCVDTLFSNRKLNARIPSTKNGKLLYKKLPIDKEINEYYRLLPINNRIHGEGEVSYNFTKKRLELYIDIDLFLHDNSRFECDDLPRILENNIQRTINRIIHILILLN